MDYQTAIGFAQSWGLVFLFVLFVGVIAYTFFWPGNKKKFEEASRIPLDEDDDTVKGGKGQ